jgi:hypothetical protein
MQCVDTVDKKDWLSYGVDVIFKMAPVSTNLPRQTDRKKFKKIAEKRRGIKDFEKILSV